jgi:hypothetical protein
LRFAFVLGLLPALAAAGCETPTGTGALTGGALGAGAGALVGAAVHHPVAGALVGGALGAGSGAIVGNGVERAERREAAREAAQAQALGLADVVTLTQQHVGDEVIINQIRTSRTVYNLRAEDIVYLRQNGVSEPVILEMQATASRYPRVYSPRPYYPGEVIVVEPAPPPPPVSVGVGVGIGGRFH